MRVKLYVIKEFERTTCSCVKSEYHDYGNGQGSGMISVNGNCPICHGMGFTLKEIEKET